MHGRLKQKDEDTDQKLQEFRNNQAEGAWLNELCEKYYKEHPRPLSATWPSETFQVEDRKLRDCLAFPFMDGKEVRTRICRAAAH